LLRGTIGPIHPPRDRRAHPRYHVRLPINLRIERWSPAILIDLSRGGLWLRTRARSPLGNSVRVSLECHAGLSCAHDGRVVRALMMPQIGGFAVRFATDDAMHELFDAVETLPQRSRTAFLATELAPRIVIAAGD